MSNYENKYTLMDKHFSTGSTFAIELRLMKMIPAPKLFSQRQRNLVLFFPNWIGDLRNV